MISLCLHHAVRIERSADESEWSSLLATIPEECKAECAEYLRDISRRTKVAIEARKKLNIKDWRRGK